MGYPRVNKVTGQVVQEEALHWQRQWLNISQVLDHNGTETRIDDQPTGQRGYNVLAAGNSQWWGSLQPGLHRADGSVLDMQGGDPYADWDGALVYVRPFNADWREIVSGDGTVLVAARQYLTQARCADGLVTWQDSEGTGASLDGTLRRVPSLGEQTFRPLPFWYHDQPWVLETTHVGFVLRPIDSTVGHRFDNHGHSFNPDVYVEGDRITVWYTYTEGGDLRFETFTGPGAELVGPVDPPEPPIEPPIEPPVEPPIPPVEPPVEPPEPSQPPSQATLVLRCHDGVHYVCAELDGSMNATRTAEGPWETFQLVPGEQPGTNGLRSHHGKYVCAEEGGGGVLVANRERVGPWESFTLLLHPGGGVSLQTHNGLFVCAEEGGGGEVNATRTGMGPWETFNGPGVPPEPGPGPGPSPGPGVSGPLHQEGKILCTPDGARFLWRGATSFRLLQMVANGEEDQAVERMLTLRAMGFSLVRVLATAQHLFPLPAELGRTHLRRLAELAQEVGLYVEIVALADTKDWARGQLEAQLYEVYKKATDTWALLVEGGNEIGPVHGTQSDQIVEVCRGFDVTGPTLYCPGSVHGGGLCKEQSALTDAQWRYGQEHDEWPYWDEVHTYGYSYGTSHLKRDGSDANRGRRVRELENSTNLADCLFVDDEPLGAGDVTEPGRRSSEPGVFYLQGVLSRIFEVGSTFHSQDGLYSLPFSSIQQGCAEGFINGSRIVADHVRLTFKNTGWADSPVKTFGGAVRVYSGLGEDNIACVIAPEPGFWIEYQNGWKDGGIRADVTGCRVISLVR